MLNFLVLPALSRFFGQRRGREFGQRVEVPKISRFLLFFLNWRKKSCRGAAQRFGLLPSVEREVGAGDC